MQGSGNVLGITVTCVGNLPLHFATFAPIRFARNTRTGQPSAPPRTGGRTAASTTCGQSRPSSPARSPSPRGGGRRGGAGGGSQRANSARPGRGEIGRPRVAGPPCGQRAGGRRPRPPGRTHRPPREGAPPVTEPSQQRPLRRTDRPSRVVPAARCGRPRTDKPDYAALQLHLNLRTSRCPPALLS